MRLTLPSRVVALTLQPTGQSPQTVGTSWISQGRASKRYVVEVSAPTGQSSITLPLNGARYGSASDGAVRAFGPRVAAARAPAPAARSPQRGPPGAGAE